MEVIPTDAPPHVVGGCAQCYFLEIGTNVFHPRRPVRPPGANSKRSNEVSFNAWLGAAIIVVAVIIAFWPAFSAGFIWDDDSMLMNNPIIGGPLHRIWFSTDPVDYFPLTYTTLWLEWRVWAGNPLGYHIVNVLLHAGSCVLLWRSLVKLRFPLPLLAALLFAVHPVNVESVAWVAERKNVLAMFFLMAASYGFVEFIGTGKKRFYALSLISFALSLLAKPAAAPWPVVALGIAWLNRRWSPLFVGETSSTAEKGRTARVWRKGVGWVAPFFGIAAISCIAAMWFQTHRSIANDVLPQRSIAERAMVAADAVWFYLGKAVMPVRLSFVYPQWDVNAHSVRAFVPGLCLVALFVVLWRWSKVVGKGPLLGLSYFVVMLSPVVGFVDIYFYHYSYVADHWQYFALPAITTLAILGLSRWKMGWLAGCGLVGVCGVLTFAQAQVYHDPETLWADTLRKNPNCGLALNNLGILRQNEGKFDAALELYRRSLKAYPNQSKAHTNIGNILLKLGQAKEAEAEFREAIRIEPGYSPAHYDLGGVLQAGGKVDDAIAEYREAIRCNSLNLPAYSNLGCLLAMKGNRSEGVATLRQVLAIAPGYVDALSNLAAILTDDGKADQGLPFGERAVALNPRSATAHFNLGNTLFVLQQWEAAQKQFEAALDLDPSLIKARFGLANCLLHSHRADEAIKEYEQVLEQNPAHAESHVQLAMLYSASKKKRAAIQHLREAVRLKPEWPTGLNDLAWFLATDVESTSAEQAEALRLAQKAVELSGGRDPAAWDTLAVTQARSEDFSSALEAARRGMQVANERGQTNLAAEIGTRIALYIKRMPFIDR